MSRFETVPIKKPGRNVFDLSHDVKSSYKFDYVYPFLCHEIYPGDTFNCRAEVFMRTMPLLTPVMHNVDMYFWYVFCPSRLTWNEKRKDDWKVFITGGEKGDANPVKPFFTWEQIEGLWQQPFTVLGITQAEFRKFLGEGSLMDHIGMPTLLPGQDPGTSQIKIDALPLRAYATIWNEYFRNQNVQDEIEFSHDSGQLTNLDLGRLLQLRRKNYEKDYFTACLPWQQRGEAQPMPLDTSRATISVDPDVASTLQMLVNSNGDVYSNTIVDDLDDVYNIGLDANGKMEAKSYPGGAVPQALVRSTDNTVTLSLDDLAAKLKISGISIGTISDLRESYRIQAWLENNARCGSRYIEQILAHFGIMSSDARLQRPELLGGGKVPLIFTDVEQQSGTVDNEEYPTVQGNLAGKGTLYGKTDGFKKSFEEHGWLFGLCAIVPRTSYQNGLPRQFTRFNRLDYYFPEFANLSEQAILKKEVFFSPADGYEDDDIYEEAFGYQERFVELRYIPSTVHGQMRTTLQSWHLGRVFNSRQTLNSDFVEAKTRANIFAIEDVQQGTADPFVCQIHNDIKAVRPLPKYAIPSL